VTGSGCTLGTTISAYLAANPHNKLQAAIAGIVHFEIAAEVAATREDVQGPGTFVPAFVDELYQRMIEVVEEREDWLDWAKVETIRKIPNAGLLKEL
jgi:thiamine-phosphate diphosphorylase/hydroxyethylthiazole kinase